MSEKTGYPGAPQSGYPGSPQSGYPGAPQSGYPGAPQSGYPGAPPAENPNSGNLYPSVPPSAYHPYDQQPMPMQTMPPPVVQTVMIQAPHWGHDPVRTTCSNCRNEVTSAINSEPGVVAWVAAGILCFVGCSFGCCLIPFCMDSMKQTTHRCPNCHMVMGKSKSGL